MYNFQGKVAAVLGGDKRELEIARNLIEQGAVVRTYGVVQHPDYDKLLAGSLLEAVEAADIIIAPVPGISAGDVLYAPAAQEPLVISVEVLSRVKDGACFFSGVATSTIREKGKANAIRFFDLKDDDYLQVMHAIPTAEGAISVTVQESEHTIHGSQALVVGYGRIATLLAKNLRGMGANVTVAARRPEVRVRAYADGHQAIGTSKEELKEAASRSILIYNTVPSDMIDRDVLAIVRKDALVMDLASPPGGIDHDAGREVGLHVVWARGQAGKAPIHSGYAQFLSIQDHLNRL